MALSSYIPRSRLHAIVATAHEPRAPSCEEGLAAVMMVDLARFTQVSERLSALGPLGAEKMSELLDTFYGEVADAVFDAGGDVVAFAGDGMVSMWPVIDDERDTVCRATRCASEIARRTFGSSGLGVRSAVGFGELRTYELGGAEHWTTLFAGPCMGQLASAIRAGEPGEVVLSEAAFGAAQGALRAAPIAASLMRLSDAWEGPPASLGFPIPPPPPVSDHVLRRFLPPVLNAIVGDREAPSAQWSAAFRSVSVAFVNLTELDIDPIDALDTLQTAFEIIDEVVQHHEGTTYQFLMDDNGISAVLAFGLPGTSLERRHGRALAASLAIEKRLASVSIPSAIGVASGRLFCGVCGNERRRAYAMVGHPMNVAARLMQHGEHRILCDEETATAAGEHVRCEALGALAVRGLRLPLEAFRPVAVGAPKRTFQPLLGREGPRDRVLARLVAEPGDRHPPIVVEGEAGVGKSHLLADLVQAARARGLRVLRGAGHAIERATAFYPWRAILTELLGGELDAAGRRHALERAVAGEPQLETWAPALGALLPLGMAETEVTEEMSAAARADSIGALVVHLLERAAAEERVALVLDDAHWFDSVSLRLLLDVVRKAKGVMVLVGTRPTDGAGAGPLTELANVPGAERIVLDRLPRDVARRLIERRLGVRAVPDAVEAFVWERAEGHPLHSEELALALVGQGIVAIAGDTCRLVEGRELEAATVPDSLEGAITSHFDRVSVTAQLAIRTAAVIGQSFTRSMLAALFPVNHHDRGELERAIDDLSREGIFVEEPDHALSFRHVTMQDVVYEGLLHGQRRELHRRAAAFIEERQGADLGAVLVLLAYHWERAGEMQRAIEFLEEAGKQALDAFSNLEARGLVERALALATDHGLKVDEERRARWLEMLAIANLMLTELDTAGELFTESLRMRQLQVPETRAGLALRVGVEVVRQVWHRLRPPRRAPETSRMLVEANGYGRLSEIAYFQNRPLELVHNCLRSLNAAEVAGAARETAQGYTGTAIMLVLSGMHETSRRYRDRGIELARERLGPAEAALTFQLACVHALSVGDWAVAEAVGGEAAAINERLGDRFRMQTCLITVGFRWLFTGDFERADAVLSRAIASAGPGGAPQIRLWGHGGRLAARLPRGLDLPFLQDLEALLEDNAQTSSSEAILCRGLLAAAYGRAGEPARARRAARRVLATLEDGFPVTYWMVWGIAAAADVLLSANQDASDATARRDAARICDVLRTYAWMLPTARPAAGLMRGRLAWQRGKTRRALAHWRAAAQAGDALGMPLEAARAARWLAAGSGDRRGLDAATARLEALGAASWQGDVAWLERIAGDRGKGGM